VLLPTDAAGVVVDGDSLHLDAQCRRRRLEELAATLPDLTVTVHSFDFDNAHPSRIASGLVTGGAGGQASGSCDAFNS
jgi:hypothetical protein